MPSTATPIAPFLERREATPANANAGRERRQFANNHDHLSSEAGELATAIDQYKLQHRRRFINFEEMLSIMKSFDYEVFGISQIAIVVR